jgi:hypothetical protein
MLPITFHESLFEMDRKSYPMKRYQIVPNLVHLIIILHDMHRYTLDSSLSPPIEDCVKPSESIASMLDRALRDAPYSILDMNGFQRWIAKTYRYSISVMCYRVIPLIT